MADQLDALPDGYKVEINKHRTIDDHGVKRVELHTQYETLLYTAEGAQQLGEELIKAGEKLEEEQDGTNN